MATQPNKFVADTVAFILYLLNDKRLGDDARATFEAMENGDAFVFLPSIVFAELLIAIEKRRIPLTLHDIEQYLEAHENCHQLQITFDIISTAHTIEDIPELHDRMIAACGVHLNYPVITNDRSIRAASSTNTVW